MLLVSAIHFWKIVNPDKGVPAILPLLFPNSEIRNGTFMTNEKVPYAANPVYLTELLSVLSDGSISNWELPDSFLVVDTRKGPVTQPASSIKMLLHSNGISKIDNGKQTLLLPFSVFAMSADTVVFTTGKIYSYLQNQSILVFGFLCILHAGALLSNFGICILFLTISSLFFRNRHLVGTYVKIAVYACTPIALADCITSIAGVKEWWTTYVSYFITMYIFFRAISFIDENNADRTHNRREEGE